MNPVIFLLAGACGALVKDVLKDNTLRLPKIEDGNILLGFLGGVIVGAFAGLAIDGSPITAFLGGFTGSQVIESLILRNSKHKV